jgi:hypothetical protein
MAMDAPLGSEIAPQPLQPRRSSHWQVALANTSAQRFYNRPPWQSGPSASTTPPRRSICAGRFAFALDQIAPTLQGLRQSLGQSSSATTGVETAIMSTCNRTEIYCAGDEHTHH